MPVVAAMSERPPIRRCSGKKHSEPFLHSREITTKIGKRVTVYECCRCYKTRHKEGRRRIRWAEPYSTYCKVCILDTKAALAAPRTPEEQASNDAWLEKFLGGSK